MCFVLIPDLFEDEPGVHRWGSCGVLCLLCFHIGRDGVFYPVNKTKLVLVYIIAGDKAGGFVKNKVERCACEGEFTVGIGYGELCERIIEASLAARKAGA